jgi:cytidylate kinase
MSSSLKIIAIDGPAASGKSTLGLNLARALGYLFFDTGVMYRAITWLAIHHGLDLNDAEALTKLAETVEIDIRPASQEDGRTSDIISEGLDLTWEIRRPEVDANVSQVSAYPGVRNALTQQQRRIGLRGEIVMVGRDIGTVVLPEAPLKIYLDASVPERARRRFQEIVERGETANYAEILEKIKKRDQIDSSRDVAPLRAASDAVVIQSDSCNAKQVFDHVLVLIEKMQTQHSRASTKSNDDC